MGRDAKRAGESGIAFGSHNRPKAWWVGPSAMAMAALAHAADAEVTERAYFSELPMVLTVSRLAQSAAEAPGSVTVLDRELIRASGARQVADLLRFVPGFQVTSASQESARATYHGLGQEYPSRVQVLIDGRSQYSPFYFGGVNWNILPVALEDIDRIEVIRGSNAAAYGSNAFLGVVNIITRHAAESQGVTAAVSSGNYGQRDARFHWGGGSDAAKVGVSYETRQDDGLVNLADDRHSRLADLRADLRLSTSDELQLGLGGIHTDVGQGVANRPSNPLRTLGQEHSYLHLGWRRAMSGDEEINLRYAHSEDRATDRHREYYPPFTVDVNFDAKSWRDDLEFQHTLVPRQDARLVWGLGARSDSVQSRAFYASDNTVSRQVTRVFGNLEWRPYPAWIANLGATLERDSISGSTLAPRLSVNHHVAPGHTLRVAVSRAYRTPSPFEAKGSWAIQDTTGLLLERVFLADPSVEPERIIAREIGYVGEIKGIGLSMDARAFWEAIPNRILDITRALQAPNCEPLAGAACGAADYSTNAHRIRIRGLEYQLRWQPRLGTRMLLNQSFVRMAAENLDFETIESADNIERYLLHARSSAPTHSATFMLMQKLPWNLDFSIAYHAVGAMKWTRNSSVDAYHRVDWRIAQSFRLGQQRGELAYTAQDDNGAHAEFRDGQVITPRHYVTLRLDF